MISNTKTILLAVVIGCWPGSSGWCQELLPGELKIDFGRALIDPVEFPTIKQLKQRVAPSAHRTGLVFRFYGDQHNHYAPKWNRRGSALSVIRSDIEAHTSKIIIASHLGAEKLVPLYPNADSYDHMFSWSTSGGDSFAFASTNEPAEQENLHFASLQTMRTPQRVTTGSASKLNPALWTTADAGTLIFGASGSLNTIPLDLRNPRSAKASSILGRGTEAQWSPDGDFLAWIERLDVPGGQQQDSLKLFSSKDGEQTRLCMLAGMTLRNPTWAPGAKHIAFYARPNRKPNWSLYAIRVPGVAGALGLNSAPVRLAENLRVEEHFLNHGPSWSPNGERIWYLGKSGDQEYYPILWVSVDGSERGEVNYPSILTTAMDLSVNPNPATRAIVFCAVENLRQDVVVVILTRAP